MLEKCVLFFKLNFSLMFCCLMKFSPNQMFLVLYSLGQMYVYVLITNYI